MAKPKYYLSYSRSTDKKATTKKPLGNHTGYVSVIFPDLDYRKMAEIPGMEYWYEGYSGHIATGAIQGFWPSANTSGFHVWKKTISEETARELMPTLVARVEELGEKARAYRAGCRERDRELRKLNKQVEKREQATVFVITNDKYSQQPDEVTFSQLVKICKDNGWHSGLMICGDNIYDNDSNIVAVRKS